jgi:uncharacterized membrane protein
MELVSIFIIIFIIIFVVVALVIILGGGLRTSKDRLLRFFGMKKKECKKDKKEEY